MSEANLWKHLNRIMSSRWEAQRHEDKYSTGIPDVSYSTECHGWIELKYLKSEPVSGGVVKVKHYTTAQRNWLRRHGTRGGRCFLLLQVGRVYMIFDWEGAQVVGKLTMEGLMTHALKTWIFGIQPDDMIIILNEGKYENRTYSGRSP